MKGSRRGQASVEYMLLMCSTLTVAVVVGAAFQRFLPALLERALAAVLQAALDLASP